MQAPPQGQFRQRYIVQYAGWVPLTAFTATLVTLWWLTRSRLSKFALDHPNERSLHTAPVPRSGGIGLAVGVALAWTILSPSLPVMLWPTLAVLWTVSLIDDMRGLPIIVRLATQLLAATAIAVSLLLDEFGVVAVLAATFAMTWMTNLYNFMDGVDGLAGGMALFGFGFYGLAAWGFGDNFGFALLNFSIAAAAAAFLVFNFPPAKIFMGDVGSVPLGFLAGVLGLLGWLQQTWAWWFPLLVFSPFIVDASVTLARRALRGERVWQAHRDHYYQRLVQMGWGHRRTAGAEYVLMAVCGGMALLISEASYNMQMTMLASIAVLYVLLMVMIERAWRRFKAAA